MKKTVTLSLGKAIGAGVGIYLAGIVSFFAFAILAIEGLFFTHWVAL